MRKKLQIYPPEPPLIAARMYRGFILDLAKNTNASNVPDCLCWRNSFQIEIQILYFWLNLWIKLL